jgi:hypothetical protein
MLASLENEAAKVGLKITVNKSKEIHIAMNNNETLCTYSETTERVTQFAYLGSIIDTQLVQRLISRSAYKRPRQHSAH